MSYLITVCVDIQLTLLTQLQGRAFSDGTSAGEREVKRGMILRVSKEQQ